MQQLLHPGRNAITIPTVNSQQRSTELALEDLSVSWHPPLSNVALVTISEEPLAVNKSGQGALTSTFDLPSWFWDRSTEKASGFFHVKRIQYRNGSRADHESSASRTGRYEKVQTISRFLVKHNIVANTGKIEYHWERLTFFCTWHHNEQPKFICFLPADSQDGFKRFALENDFSKMTDSAFAPHIKALEYVVSRFDQSVWGWRDVVRDCETSRPAPGTMTPTWVARMHEVARHVIHTSEMLQTALNATESLLGEVAGLPGEHGTVDKENVSDENAVYVKTMLQCILLRSQALEKRIQNELQFAFHRSTQHDSLTIQRDSLTMKTISVLGLLFLPGTFISAIFSMSFFSFTPGDARTRASWEVSEDFWVYWVVAVPATAVTVMVWFLWQRHVDKASLLKGTSREVDMVLKA